MTPPALPVGAGLRARSRIFPRRRVAAIVIAGLFIGIGVSILLLVYRASRPHIAVLGRDPGGGRPLARPRATSRQTSAVPAIDVTRR